MSENSSVKFLLNYLLPATYTAFCNVRKMTPWGFAVYSLDAVKKLALAWQSQ